MKRRSVIALLAAAALLTGCSSGGNSVEGSAVLTGSAGSVGSVGSASPASSAEYGTPGASGAVVSVPDSSAASADSGGSGGSAGSVSPVSSADSAASSPVMSTAAPSTAAPEHSAGESPSDDYAPTDIGGVKSGDSVMALPEGEEFADAEMAAADGFADCPGPTDPLVPIDPIDPIGPIDPIEPEEPWIDPRAGLLTGGEWNDNENWDFWNSLYSSSNYGADWAGYLETWRTGMEYRAAVTVRDSSGAAVSGCDKLFGNVRCRRILHPQSTHRVLIDHAHNAVFDVALFCRTGKPDAFFAVFIILQVRLAGGGCNVEIKALH